MVALGDVKRSAATLFAQGQHLAALRLYDAIVAAAPLDYDARIRVADCALALGDAGGGRRVSRDRLVLPEVRASARRRSSARACSRRTAPTPAISSPRSSSHYGSESELLGKVAARIALPAGDAAGARCPTCALAAPPDAVASRARRAPSTRPTSSRTIPRRCTRSRCCRRCPRPRSGACSATLVAAPPARRRARDPRGRARQLVLLRRRRRAARVRDRRPRPADRARPARRERGVRRDGAALGAAALARRVGCVDRGRSARGRARSRSRRSPTSSAAVAEALHGFTRERLLGNLMATSPLFKPFKRMQQRDLLRRFTSHDVAPGTVVINEGEEGRGLFVVLSGELDVSRRAADGTHGAARRAQDRRRVRRDVAAAKCAHDRDGRRAARRRRCCSSRASTSPASSPASPKSGAISKRWPRIARSTTSSCSARTRLRADERILI